MKYRPIDTKTEKRSDFKGRHIQIRYERTGWLDTITECWNQWMDGYEYREVLHDAPCDCTKLREALENFLTEGQSLGASHPHFANYLYHPDEVWTKAREALAAPCERETNLSGGLTPKEEADNGEVRNANDFDHSEGGTSPAQNISKNLSVPTLAESPGHKTDGGSQTIVSDSDEARESVHSDRDHDSVGIWPSYIDDSRGAQNLSPAQEKLCEAWITLGVKWLSLIKESK